MIVKEKMKCGGFMVSSVSISQLEKSIELQRDFYKSELLNLGYFKTHDGRQLYELELDELKDIYFEQRVKNCMSSRR